MKTIFSCKWFLVVVFLHFSSFSLAQMQVEMNVGHSSYYYQHSFFAKLKSQSRFGFFHISSILVPYSKERGNEIMSQSYVSYSLSDLWVSGIGSIYTPMSHIRPSFFLQYFKKFEELSILLFPRADLWTNPSFELTGFIEYKGSRNRDLNIYSRLQLQTIWNLQEHLRSTQFVRIGIDLEEAQFGIGANFDQYGSSAEWFSSIGLFLKKEF